MLLWKKSRCEKEEEEEEIGSLENFLVTELCKVGNVREATACRERWMWHVFGLFSQLESNNYIFTKKIQLLF